MEDFNEIYNQILGGAEMCFENKYYVPTLMIIYSGIDIMSWLDLPEEKEQTGRTYFKNWVEKYLMPCQNLKCNSEDLYAARCGILHSFSCYSSKTRNNIAEVIFYSTNPKQNKRLEKINKSYKRKALAISIPGLLSAFNEGVKRFKNDIENDVVKKDLVKKRIEKSCLSYVSYKSIPKIIYD